MGAPEAQEGHMGEHMEDLKANGLQGTVEADLLDAVN